MKIQPFSRGDGKISRSLRSKEEDEGLVLYSAPGKKPSKTAAWSSEPMVGADSVRAAAEEIRKF